MNLPMNDNYILKEVKCMQRYGSSSNLPFNINRI